MELTGEYTVEKLLKRAVRGARARHTGEHERWVAISDVFGLGSTFAMDLCRKFDLDPHEKITGARCKGCNP